MPGVGPGPLSDRLRPPGGGSGVAHRNNTPSLHSRGLEPRTLLRGRSLLAERLNSDQTPVRGGPLLLASSPPRLPRVLAQGTPTVLRAPGQRVGSSEPPPQRETPQRHCSLSEH